MKPSVTFGVVALVGCSLAFTFASRDFLQVERATTDAEERSRSTAGDPIAEKGASPVQSPNPWDPRHGDYDATATDREDANFNPRIPSAGIQAGAAPVPSAVRGRRVDRNAATPRGAPRVSSKMAFTALNFVGVDPRAEKIWMLAINDPQMPPGVRSDLIEDLHDEGYTDNDNPGKEDLPLIIARLELIERLAPYAMDQVNADAFEEAYKDLLDKYVRLGGPPRK